MTSSELQSSGAGDRTLEGKDWVAAGEHRILDMAICATFSVGAEGSANSMPNAWVWRSSATSPKRLA
jgi:hypothetical protein